MVAAKYLRAAPHPDTWDERGEALLKSLGGNKAKRSRVLRETLASLDTENLVRKVPRPGRKTNAENAIAFYRHVLAMNDGEGQGDEELSEMEEAPKKARKRTALPKKNVEEGSQTGAASVASMDSEEFRMQHNDLCEVCNDGGELVCCSTCNLVFHLHCIRPPTSRFPPDKWCCAYCVAAGVRGHTKEARTRRRAAAAAREMTRMKNELNPPDESTDDEETMEPPKKRRGRPPKRPRVPQAIDQTKPPADHKEELVQKKRGRGRPPKRSREPQPSDEKEPAAEQTEEPVRKKRGRPPKQRIAESETKEEAKPAAEQTEEPARKKRGRPPKNRIAESEAREEAKADEVKTTEAKVEDQKVATEESADGRTSPRRERRQPTLYNPQAGAASTWQSDGKHEWKSLGSDDDTSMGTDGKETDEETEASGKSVLCSFCGDDPNIPVCCFCACRGCYGKHDKSKLLICDRCDAEWHIYCLDPPLKSVPHTKKWFCATCKADMKPEAGVSPETKTEGKRRGPGRPPKSAVSIDDIPVLPKRRGRPPKKLVEDVEEDEPIVKKKRRGRPPKKKPPPPPAKKKSPPATKKKAKSSPMPDTPIRSNVGKKRRGRPPKKKNIQSGNAKAPPVPSRVEVPKPPAPVPPTGMRLVAPKAPPGFSAGPPAGLHSFPGAVNTNPTTVAMTPQASAPVLQKSRSGRTFKRNPFHDEIYEGRQLGQPKRSDMGPPATGRSKSVGQAAPSYQPYLQQAPNVPVPNLTMAPVGATGVAGSAPPMIPGMNAPGPIQVSTQPSASLNVPMSTMGPTVMYTPAGMTPAQGSLPVPPAVLAYPTAAPNAQPVPTVGSASKQGPRRKPGARECMQISRRFGVKVIPQAYMDILFDYCARGKVDHLIRMRERLDEHSRLLESQLAGLEALVKEKGELDITVPAAEPRIKSPPKS